MKHKKTAIAIAVAGLMGLSPYAIAGEGWGDKAKQKMESAGDSVERGAETTTEKVKGFFGSDEKQEQAAISPDSLSKDQITEVQKALNEKGFHAANVDGEMGEETSKALRNFQENEGITASGELNKETLDALGVDIDVKQAQEESEVAPVEEQQDASMEKQEQTDHSEHPEKQESESVVPQEQQESEMQQPQEQQESASVSSPSPLNSDQVTELQQALNEKGYDAGNVDGIIGPETRGAIESFQQEKGITASGELNQETIDALGLDVDLKQAQEESGSQMFSE